MKTILLLSALLCVLGSASSKTISEMKLEILDQILPKNENEIMIAPENLTGDHTIVEATLCVNNFDNINEEKGEITLKVYLRQFWYDYRLKYPANTEFECVSVNNEDAIWTPDTSFVNEKKEDSFDALGPNSVFFIYPDGYVVYTKKFSVTLNCPMDFKAYPFDQPVCGIRLKSYANTADNFKLNWKEGILPIGVAKNPISSVFHLQAILITHGMVEFQKNHTFLEAKLYLRRNLTYCILHIYLPSVAMVVLSWLPLWMKKNMITSRLLISVGAFFSFIMIVCKFNDKRPQSQYSISMFCFTSICAAFLILSSILSVMVHIFDKNNKEPAKLVENGHLSDNHKKLKWRRLLKQLPHKSSWFDVGARFIVPVAFTLFCVTYFMSSGFFSTAVPIAAPR